MTPRLAALALAAAATACASLAPPPALAPLEAVPAAFEVAGRLSVRQGPSGEIAKMRWTHRPGSDLWIVSSPLGTEVQSFITDCSNTPTVSKSDEYIYQFFNNATINFMRCGILPAKILFTVRVIAFADRA